ncbi:MAG: DNA recombination protein RmuC [Candidatus Omnitrophica bacterium]|nr:DNA recombination protein RmuC [Candidatus Omnitrophota bacterium]MDD5352894.1 DNA recombination protein RmuC [Candidatus Omnitrophota bacterium]MDD5550493.1 DNA recombination protein RmuC [Candidatus Omnitrophota bacterium]
MLTAAIVLFVLGFALILVLVFKLSFQLNTQLNAITQQLNERLKDNTDTLLKTQRDVTDRLNKISDVEKSLVRMEETYKQVLEISKDISSLQDLFRAPKFRGGIGEFSLENLLSQIMPKDFFSTQYSFKNGTKADAVIKIGNNLVAIDAKFPLESFNRMVESQSEEEKKTNRRQFVRDVQNRIDEIALKYILPDEGTYDFALMYIPAENVYYESILKDIQEKDQKSIHSYALNKKVIPVSPHSLYPYLMVILRGLKGLAIEKNAKQVIEHLSRLQVDLNKFKEDFRLVGGHISNAKTKYEEAEKRLDRFSDKLISGQTQTKLVE